MRIRCLQLSICLIGGVMVWSGSAGGAAPEASRAPLKWSVQALNGVTIPGLPPVNGHIHVDQFGYLPDEHKVAVISDPEKGFNAGDHFTPGPVLELRRVADGVTVCRGAPEAFNRGQIDTISGDRGWWFDFTG